MTQPPAQPPSPSSSLVGRTGSAADYVDAAFDAFVQSNFVHWVRYAHLQVGDAEDAELITREVSLQLHETWAYVLGHYDNVPMHALGLLRSEIERWRQEHGIADQLVENAAFLRTMRAAETDFALLAESLGIFSAIARLPERQHQAIILRFALGYRVKQVAALMGVTPTTVVSLTHRARRALARDLGIPLEAAEKEGCP